MCQKCDFYVRGLPNFEVQTDHRPLEGVFTRQMHSMENVRLLRMREKLARYNFTVRWTPDKSNNRRRPQQSTDLRLRRGRANNKLNHTMSGKLRETTATHITQVQTLQPPESIHTKLKPTDSERDHGALQKRYGTRLSVTDNGLITLDCSKLLVPEGLKKTFLKVTHGTHKRENG